MTAGVRTTLVYAGATVLLLGALVVATTGFVGAVLACLFLAGLASLVTIGLERTAFLVLVGAFATAPMYRGLSDLSGNVATPTDLLVLLALVLLLPVVLTRPLELPPYYLLGLLLVAAGGLVASVLAASTIGSLFGLIRLLIFLGALPIAFVWWRPGVTRVVILLWAYVLGHLASTAYAFASGPTVGNRYQGLTHHTNAYGMAGLTAIAILIYLFWHHRGSAARVIVIGAGVVSAASVFTSGSRAALAVAVVLVLLVPVLERSATLGLTVALVSALGVALLPMVVQNGVGGSALTRLTGDGTAVAADQARADALDEGLRRLSSSPILGSGLVDVEYFHNIYLEVAVGVGLFGLLGYLIVMVVFTRPLLTNHPHRRLSYLPLAFIGLAPALPLIWDETMWVPIGLVTLATLRERPGDPPARAGEGEPAVPARAPELAR